MTNKEKEKEPEWVLMRASYTSSMIINIIHIPCDYYVGRYVGLSHKKCWKCNKEIPSFVWFQFKLVATGYYDE